jgi:hypothetical protein
MLINRKARAASKIEHENLAEAGVLARGDGTTTKPANRSTSYRALKKQ